MAILKHLSSKNANYDSAIEYLTQQYDEVLSKPILDENGMLQEREEYKIKYFNSSGVEKDIEDWEKDCIMTNLKYGKNKNESEVKTHHYILAFEDDDNLSLDEVETLAVEFAKEHFEGYQMLIGTHPGHAHIVINSVRDQERELDESIMLKKKDGSVQDWEYKAGYKHQASNKYINYLKKKTMEFCLSRGLNQVDLLKNSNEKKSDKEFYAERQAAKEGKITYKEYIRRVLKAAKKVCKTNEEFQTFLKENGVQTELRGQHVRYKTEEGEKWIRAKTLGQAYLTPAIIEALNYNYEESQRMQQALDIFMLQGYEDKNKRPYQISLYGEDGHRRTVLESVLILAMVAMTGEVEEYMLPKYQQNQIMKEKAAAGKNYIKELEDTLQMIEDLQINSYKDLKKRSFDSTLSIDERVKIGKIKKVYEEAYNAEKFSQITGKVMQKEKDFSLK